MSFLIMSKIIKEMPKEYALLYLTKQKIYT